MLKRMRPNAQAFRKILSAGLLGFVLVPWFPWGCEKRPQAPPPPPPPPPPSPPSYFELAETHFETGHYANAAQAYETFLNRNPSAADQDKALFRLALAHAFPESPVHDPQQALQILQQLVSLFPESPYRPEAEFLLRLQGEIERLRSDLSNREARIRQLTQELERLKQIDMQRRPSRVPP